MLFIKTSVCKQNVQKEYSEFHGFRSLLACRLFWVDFDHFGSEFNFLRQLGQWRKLAPAENRTAIIKFSFSKCVKHSVSFGTESFCWTANLLSCSLRPSLQRKEYLYGSNNSLFSFKRVKKLKYVELRSIKCLKTSKKRFKTCIVGLYDVFIKLYYFLSIFDWYNLLL